jgi:hypothetical protein
VPELTGTPLANKKFLATILPVIAVMMFAPDTPGVRLIVAPASSTSKVIFPLEIS